jgi:phage baseplate assembly protein W
MPQDIFYVDVACKNTGFDINYEAVENSIRNILLTPVGSLPSLPEFGSRLNALLFSAMNSNIIDVIRGEITSSIEMWEKRVIIKFVDVQPHPEYNSLEIKVYYTIKMDNDTTARVLKINMKTP